MEWDWGYNVFSIAGLQECNVSLTVEICWLSNQSMNISCVLRLQDQFIKVNFSQRPRAFISQRTISIAIQQKTKASSMICC